MSRSDRRPWWRLSRPALVAFVVLGLFVAVSFVARLRAADAEEDRALRRRADEVAALLTVAFQPISSNLDLLALVHRQTSDEPSTFDAVADGSVALFGAEAGVVDTSGDGARLVAGGTDPASAGEPVDGPLADVAEESLDGQRLAAAVVGEGSERTLVVAKPSGEHEAVYQRLPLDPVPSLDLGSDAPFDEIVGSVYVTDRPARDQLVLVAGGDVQTGPIERELVVGGDEWLLVVAAGDGLTPSLNDQLPWIILGGGIVLTLLATAFVESLVRRREYAEAQVADRTARLEQTMAALDQARLAAEESNRAKSEFLSRMSHELRTPLNAVLGFAQVLELDDLDRDQREATGQIMKGGRHLLELVNEILDLSRIEAGRLSLSPEPVLVSDLLDEAVALVRNLAEESGIRLSVNAHHTCDRHVLADRQRVKQILLNLLSNAIKYNRRNGTVAVYCEERPDRVLRIDVADTGAGIAADKRSLVFAPFERLGAEGGDIEGTGIGLALSQRLAEAMGGQLGFESVEQQGSTFWCDLPLVEGPVERFERLTPPTRQLAPATLPRRPVLYIEDNLANLKLMERVLERLVSDVEIIAAMQGRLGLELAREHQPSVILLDLHLPDLGGDEVLERLRTDPATAGIPVVMVSADASPNQVQRLLAAGAASYLTKPLVVQELLDTLTGLLSDEERGR